MQITSQVLVNFSPRRILALGLLALLALAVFLAPGAQPAWAQQIPTVWLSVPLNPVVEPADANVVQEVYVEVNMSAPLSAEVTIPLTYTLNTAETGDIQQVSEVVMRSGARSIATIVVNPDTDTDDETFTVALGTLPSSVTASTAADKPTSVRVTIIDSDNRPTLSGLTVANSTDGSNFTNVSGFLQPAFAAATKLYTLDVSGDYTHVRVAATWTDTRIASVKMGKFVPGEGTNLGAGDTTSPITADFELDSGPVADLKTSQTRIRVRLFADDGITATPLVPLGDYSITVYREVGGL